MEVLKNILEGREARALLQRELLREADMVLQAALNVPGFPKRVPGDEELLCRALNRFFELFGVAGRKGDLHRLENGAGLAFVVGYLGRDPAEAKRKAVQVETEKDWGRVLDMDIISLSGVIGRSELGLPPRCCLLCERDAKVCSRLCCHSPQELRQTLIRLVARSSL